jgi:hypothetical protein
MCDVAVENNTYIAYVLYKLCKGVLMKSLFTKKAMVLIFAAVFIFGSFLLLAYLQKAAHPTTNNQTPQQTALATVFAPTEHPPVLTLTSVQADSDTLKFTLVVSKLELVKNSDDFENIICDPYLQINPPVQQTIKYRESQIPEKAGDPIVITYEYDIEAKTYQSLSVDITFTIGPCGPDFKEAIGTPYPTVDLIAAYKLAFTVPIK